METLMEMSSFNLWLLLILMLTLRYVLVAGIPYLWLYIIGKSRYKASKIQNAYPSRKQILEEIKYSLITMYIYSSGIWFFLNWLKNGVTKNYTELHDFGIPYFILSVFLMIVMHDMYSYWIHRLMHHKLIFKYTHLLHHKFHNPSPWSAFAFHPFEAILTMGIIPLIVFTIPWHNLALVIFITIMIFYDTYVHWGFNISAFKIFRWQNTPLEHDLHHRNAKYNFGLYFTIWDRLMGTFLKKM